RLHLSAPLNPTLSARFIALARRGAPEELWGLQCHSSAGRSTRPTFLLPRFSMLWRNGPLPRSGELSLCPNRVLFPWNGRFLHHQSSFDRNQSLTARERGLAAAFNRTVIHLALCLPRT